MLWRRVLVCFVVQLHVIQWKKTLPINWLFIADNWKRVLGFHDGESLIQQGIILADRWSGLTRDYFPISRTDVALMRCPEWLAVLSDRGYPYELGSKIPFISVPIDALTHQISRSYHCKKEIIHIQPKSLSMLSDVLPFCHIPYFR